MATYLTSGVLIVNSDPYATISDPAAVAAEAATRAAADTAEAAARQAADDVLTAAQTALDTRVATLELDPITATEVTTQIGVTIDALLDGAPAALDTLNELAAAIADDANYAATVTALVAAVSDRVTVLEAVDNATQAELDTHTADTEAHGITAYGADLVNSANAGEARTTLGTVAKTGDTFTGNVILEANQPTVDLRNTGSTGGRVLWRTGSIARWIMRQGSANPGQLAIDRLDASQNYLDTPFIFTDGALSLSQASSVTVPAPTGVGHVSRITAYVPATGRIQRDGMEQGDTGWRDISASLDADVTSGVIYIRRVGNDVEIAWNINAASAFPDILGSGGIPAGFRTSSSPLDNVTFSATDTSGTARAVRVGTLDGIRVLSGSTSYASLEGRACYFTDEAWPTTLPGTPVPGSAPATLS